MTGKKVALLGLSFESSTERDIFGEFHACPSCTRRCIGLGTGFAPSPRNGFRLIYCLVLGVILVRGLFIWARESEVYCQKVRYRHVFLFRTHAAVFSRCCRRETRLPKGDQRQGTHCLVVEWTTSTIEQSEGVFRTSNQERQPLLLSAGYSSPCIRQIMSCFLCRRPTGKFAV